MRFLPTRTESLALCSLLAAGLISVFSSPDPLRGVFQLKVILAAWYVRCLILSCPLDESQHDNVAVALGLFPLINVLGLAFVYFRGGFSFDTIVFNRAALVSASGSSNAIATFLAGLAPINLGIALSSARRRVRYFGALGVVACIVGVLLVLSRGGLAALAAGLTLFIMLNGRRMGVSRWTLMLMVPLGVWFAGDSVGLFDPLKYRLLGIVGQSDYAGGGFDPNVLARLDLMGVAWRMFLEHPILGVGFGGFEHFYVLYGKFWFLSDRFSDPHNYYLLLLAEGGLVTLSSFLWLTFQMMRMALRRISNGSALVQIGGFCGAIAVLGHALVEPTLRSQAGLTFLFLLLTVPVMLTRDTTRDNALAVPREEL